MTVHEILSGLHSHPRLPAKTRCCSCRCLVHLEISYNVLTSFPQAACGWIVTKLSTMSWERKARQKNLKILFKIIWCVIMYYVSNMTNTLPEKAESGVMCDKGHKNTPKNSHHKTPLMVSVSSNRTHLKWSANILNKFQLLGGAPALYTSFWKAKHINEKLCLEINLWYL